MEHYSAIKGEIMPCAATRMDLKIITLSEVNQRKIKFTWYHLHVESKENDINEPLYRTEIDPQM